VERAAVLVLHEAQTCAAVIATCRKGDCFAFKMNGAILRELHDLWLARELTRQRETFSLDNPRSQP
jgi:hypothetical protein